MASPGFTRLTKGLAVILFLGYLVPLILPWTLDYLALVPAKTIPFVWNVVTAGYMEQSVFGLIVSILGLLYSGKLLEPVWTSREFLKFILFVNTFTVVGVYVTALIIFYTTRKAVYLYAPLCGFHGVLSGFLVGLKQIIPDQNIIALGNFHIKAEWLPSILVLVSIILSFMTPNAMQYLPFVLFGTYGGWFYIRYFQRDAQVNLTGYPVEEFAFSTFFPHVMRPVIDVLSSGCEKIFCRNLAQRRGDSHNTDGSSMHDIDTAEASRWRERGARALDAKLQASASDDDTDKDHPASIV